MFFRKCSRSLIRLSSTSRFPIDSAWLMALVILRAWGRISGRLEEMSLYRSTFWLPITKRFSYAAEASR